MTPDGVAEERKASQRRGVTPDGVAEERKANGRRLARSRVMWGPRQRYGSSEHKGDLAESLRPWRSLQIWTTSRTDLPDRDKN